MNKRAQQSEADAYRRKFWIDAFKHLPHHYVIKAAKATRAEKLTRYAYRSRQIELGKAVLKPYSKEEVSKYQVATQHTQLWHGTGRYQYRNAKPIDVFSQILTHGGLLPVPDSYTVMLGGEKMSSVSTTPLRIIARSYADTHGKGASEKNRYGSSLWWVSYYYGPFYAEVFTKNAITIAHNYKRWHRATSDTHGERAWGKKVHQNARYVWDVFGLGSDIPGNYPIIFGIRYQAKTAKLPTIMAKTESRLTSKVSIVDFTHIEVPEEKIAETEAIISRSGHSIPVFPIELGEYVASRQSIDYLLHL